MKKAIVIFVTVFLAFFFCCTLKAATIQKTIIPAEADWVIHFDLEKFSTTQIGESLLSEEGAFNLEKKNAQFKKKYQIDLLADIDGITIFGIGEQENKTVACLRGNFKRDYLLGLLAAEETHKEIPHGKYTIHNWNHCEYGVFVDDNLALMGANEDTIKIALDVIAGKKANIASSPLMAYIDEIPSNAFFAALAKDISSMAQHATKVFVFKKTESALLTLTEEKKNLNIRLNFIVKTLEDAKNMESVIRGLISLASMQLEEAHKELMPHLERINISTEGKKVRVEFSYPSKELVDIVLGKVKFSPFSLLAKYNRLP